MRRLIDANELKNDIAENSITLEGVWAIEVECAKALIDNAPTIESNDCVLKMFGECSYNETGCSDCLVKEKIRHALANHTVYEFKGCDNCELDRPKGKWIEKGNYVYCSNCNAQEDDAFANYCWHCGADMRKEN